MTRARSEGTNAPPGPETLLDLLPGKLYLPGLPHLQPAHPGTHAAQTPATTEKDPDQGHTEQPLAASPALRSME